MNVRPHPRYAEFVHRIRTLSPSPTRWAGVTFRSVELEHASPDKILSGEGSRRFGGRWNAPGTFPVIYSSTKPGTAVEEAFQLAADYELSPDDLKPRITCGIEWDLARVIDLTQKNLPSWLKPTRWKQEDFLRINDSDFETPLPGIRARSEKFDDQRNLMSISASRGRRKSRGVLRSVAPP